MGDSQVVDDGLADDWDQHARWDGRVGEDVQDGAQGVGQWRKRISPVQIVDAGIYAGTNRIYLFHGTSPRSSAA